MSHVIMTVFLMLTFSHLAFALPSALAAEEQKQSEAAMEQQANKELATLRKNPEEFRTLVTGIQIFLGRFGYGVGPFTGKLDEETKQALTAYQKKTGLTVTGDINFETLKRLTEDNQVLNRIVPHLPPIQARNEEWEKWIDVKGSWMLKEGNTDDVLHTSRITCMQVFQRCIDSTASLVNGPSPQLTVHTHVYDVKEWDENKIVSHPYDGEACAISILRLSKKPLVVTRFVSLKSSPGPCSKVKPEDRQYVLDDGTKVYQALKGQKLQAIQEILQVAH